jgi:ABC-type transport system involved in multi-copper enzyme maturation permease subunit
VSALVRSELLKVRTTRGWWAYLIVIVLLIGLATAAEIGSADDSRRGELDFQLSLVDVAGIASLLAIILGITMTTTEFRHGTITPTLLATPRRELVVAAKAVAGLLLALLFAALAFAVVAVISVMWLSLIDVDLHLGDGEILTRAAKTVLGIVTWALMGVAIGILVHGQVAALVGTLVWIFLGETLLIGFLNLLDIEGAAAYLPFQALDAADGTGGEDLLSYWPGVAISLGWIAVLGAAGSIRTRRRDIS